ncbi:hypothetical protein A3765_08025 [Oleiphilus sp. HI0130]|nr:hypothetical protein A3765_08025 [Oleiphilus sp. HI0130]
MHTKRQQNNAFLRLLLASILIHSSAIVAYLFSQEVSLPSPQQKSVKVQLHVEQPLPQLEQALESTPQEPEQQALDVPLQDQPEEHLPAHNSEEFASNNQSKEIEGKIVAGGGNERDVEHIAETEITPSTQEEIEDLEVSEGLTEEVVDERSEEAREVVSTIGSSNQTLLADAAGTAEAESSESASSRAVEEFSIDALPSLEELTIPGEFLEGIGNLELLSDGELSDALVEQPFSENESKELQLVNRYLARMNKQVLSFWINPYKGNQLHRGIIKVELSSSGYLENAYIYRSSGHTLLDISVLDAIRAVPRYEVPDNEIITARYYTNLSFHYSSIEEETELMPFEQEREEIN